MFEEVLAHLVAQGLRISRGTIVDATIINAPSSTKNASKTYLYRAKVLGLAVAVIVLVGVKLANPERTFPIDGLCRPPSASHGYSVAHRGGTRRADAVVNPFVSQIHV